MRKRLSSKLLAIILTLAICATTVFGCLMTVSAADACYSFSESKFNGDDLTQATIDVTFTAPASLPNGFVAGAFSFAEADADDEDYLIFKDVTSSDVNVSVEDNYVIFDGEAVNTAKFTFTVGFSTGAATDRTYQIALSEVELAYNDAEYYVESGSGPVGEITAACKHVIGVVGTPDAKNEANNYSVYKESVCTKCGETFGYQLVPTVDELVGGDTVSEGATIQWDGSSKTAPTEGSGTEADPYIISDVAHLAYIAEAGPDVTHGKYYKVADGIENIVLQAAADAQTLINIDSAEEAKTYISGLSKISRWGSSKYDAATAFAGFFDGNGATVYGMGSNGSINVSLFGSIGPKAEFKNLSIKNSFVQTGWYAATLAHTVQGYTLADGTAVAKGTVKIDNCTFANNYINPQSGVNGGTSGNQCIGVILGNFNASATGSGLAVNKVMTYGNITFYEQQQANISPLFGGLYSPPGPTAETETEYCELMDCILLDIPGDIFSNNNTNFKAYQNVQNVYSDSTWIATYLSNAWYNTNDANTVTKAQMLGTSAITAAPNLDWGNTWLVGADGELPRLVKPGEKFDTIYWDGTVATGFSDTSAGTKDDPIIINTAAELAYLVSSDGNSGGADPATKITVTAFSDGSPKYFKIADGIKNIVLQPYAYANEIKALDSASAVKSYFESGSFIQWKTTGWEGATFCGHFDGNGATIYGMYATSTNNAALFCTVEGGAAFENIAIKNSYLTSSADNYQVAALFGTSSSSGYGAKQNGIIWANNITIANNYMYNGCLSTQTNRSGIIGGAQEAIQVENALIYGNDATYGRDAAIYNMPAIANCSNTIAVADTHYDGLEIKTGMADLDNDKVNETTVYYNQVKNSIILGADVANTKDGRGYRKNDPDTFTNVYTDGASGTVSYSNGQWTYTDEQIKGISASDATGSGAANAMPNLTWGTDWYCGAEGEYPVQTVFATLGTSSVSNPHLALVGHNTTYNNDGSVDLNFHFVPKTTGATPVLYVGTLDGTRFMKLNATTSSLTSQLGSEALMYTLPNLSARDIDLVWLPTLVLEGCAVKEWGKSEQLALADNARAILAGDYDIADKNVAAALLNYGAASDAALNASKLDYDAGTIDLLEFGDYLIDAGSTSKWYDTVLADNGETGSSWDDAIIIDSAEEFVYLCKASGDDTAGLYYKVADGIAGFDLSNGKLDYTKGLAANLDTIRAGGKNHAGGAPGFQGHFDGNGATVYGAWTNHTDGNVSNYAGLFTCTKNTVTIKNIHVKLAAFTATTSTGGIIGYHKADELCTVTVENCSVTESYLEAKKSTAYGGGVGYIIGAGMSADALRENNTTDYNGDGDMTDTIYRNVQYNVKNCYVELDEQYVVSTGEDGVEDSGERICHGGVVSCSASNAVMVSNCVVIGVKPYATTESTAYNDVQHSGHANNFSNVYTDQLVSDTVFVGGTTGNTQDLTSVMTQLTTEQLTGLGADANMPALDWNTVWTTTNGYPTFINKNYTAPASGYTIYWDGTVATGFSDDSEGTADDPIIINTAAELAYLVKADANNGGADPTTKVTVTAFADGSPKYFKIADGITSIVLQPESKAEGIMTLGSAAEVKTHFEGGSFTEWVEVGWEQSTFCGNFDGNGATVYGLYSVSSNNAGLFSTVEGGATIKNIALKNSYLTSTATNYQVAGIVAVASATGYGYKREGVIWVNGCTVANNYMYNACTSYTRSGVIAGGMTNDVIIIDNCLVYGNDASYGDGVNMALVGQGNNDVETTATKPAELTSYIENSGFFCNSVRNSIILDSDVINEKEGASWRRNAYNCYSNVYTNGTLGETFYNGNWATQYAEVLFPITAADALGADAKTNLANLGWAEDGTGVWYVGAAGDYPGFKEAGDMPTSAQTLYNAMVLDTMDDYGDSVDGYGVYATGLNLKVNPYMTFTFVFGYEYERENIQVTFKSGDTVIETVTAAQMINNEGAGRYHLYRLKSAPVTALATGITVSVSYNGEAVDFGTYSAEGFALMAQNASKQQPCNYYATRYEAAKALLFYADMLAARYGA